VLLITIFTLPDVALIPVLGVLPEHHRRRKILVPTLLLIGINGGLRALASGFGPHQAQRQEQGMDAVTLGTLNVTVISAIFTVRSARPRWATTRASSRLARRATLPSVASWQPGHKGAAVLRGGVGVEEGEDTLGRLIPWPTLNRMAGTRSSHTFGTSATRTRPAV